MKLRENMRVKMSNDPEAEAFDLLTLKIGNGEKEVFDGTDLIEVPDDMCMTIEPNSPRNPTSEKEAMKKLAGHVYPYVEEHFDESGWLDGRAILASTTSKWIS